MRFIKWSFLSCLLLANISLFAANHDATFTFKNKQKQTQEQTSQLPKPELAPRTCPTDQAVYFTLDFLYWSAHNHGFSWANKNYDDTTRKPIDLRVLYVDEKWEPGFRFGIGWDTLHDYWDILAQWTYYHNYSKDSASSPNADYIVGGGIYPSSGMATNFIYRNGKAHWRLNYNMLDLEIGKTFYISKYLSFRAHAGTRGGWIDQSFRSEFTNMTYDKEPPIRDTVYHCEQDYWGLGPRLGINGDWHLGAGFSIFGNIAAALLYGKFDVHETQRFLAADTTYRYWTLIPGVYNEILGLKRDFYELSPNLEMIIGLSWGECFYNEKVYFGLKAGWETNYWWNQYHLTTLILDLPEIGKETHPVSMQGLTLRAKVDF